MRKSVSFDVDHSQLSRGIYLSRIDTLSEVQTLTLDIRLRAPYQEPVLSNEELHTFEHCFATAIREVSFGDEQAQIAYFGPMGCQTGFYLVVNLFNYKEEEYFSLLLKLMEDAIRYLGTMEEVPANNQLQCGYCETLGEITVAQRVAKDMDTLLKQMSDAKGFFQYKYL